MSVEQWRAVPGWPDYMVSDRGRVVSHRRGQPAELQPWTTPKGYRYVALHRGEAPRRSLAVHRLVMLAWVGPRPRGLEVRHLDGDPGHNCLANLAYGLPGANALDQVAHGTHVNAAKTECPRGHAYDAVNTRVTRGERHCRSCRREHAARYRARRRAAAA